MAKQFLRVKNFDKFQHYKDRNPPWIKLYNDLLDDYDFSCLQDASKLHLLMIWLVASRTNNKIPIDTKWIERKINATESVNLDELLASGFLEKHEENQKLHNVEQVASTTLSKRKQDDCLEGETEREGEIEKEVKKSSTPPVIKIPLNDGSEFDVMEKEVEEWIGLYPSVNIMQELRNMRGWCIGNKSKRKTRSGVLRFITSWLSKEQNKGGGAQRPPSSNNGPLVPDFPRS